MMKEIINFILSGITFIVVGYCLILLAVYMQDKEFGLVIVITSIIFAVFGVIGILRFIWNKK